MSRRPVVPGKGFHHIPRLGEEAAWEPPPRCPAVPVGPGRTGGRSVGGGVCCGACGCRRSARRWPAAVRSAVAVQPAVGLRVCCWPSGAGDHGGCRPECCGPGLGRAQEPLWGFGVPRSVLGGWLAMVPRAHSGVFEMAGGAGVPRQPPAVPQRCGPRCPTGAPGGSWGPGTR